MSVPKYKVFYNQLNQLLSLTNSTEIKSTIGDSVKNNRTPTVVQVIRFLEAIGEDTLADTLTTTYNNLYEEMSVYRDLRKVVRRDGFDINEFLTTYNESVIENSDFRSIIFKNVV